MLSREDYKQYLRQIIDIENIAFNIYKTCVDNIEDNHIKELLTNLLNDERRHGIMVRELIKLILKSIV